MSFFVSPLLPVDIFTSGNIAIGKLSLPLYTLDVNGTLFVTGNTTHQGLSLFTNTTQSTSSTTGSLQVGGGAGIVGNLYVGGNAIVTGNTTHQGLSLFTNTTQSTSSATGALQVTGGAGIGANLYVGGNTTIAGTNTITGNVVIKSTEASTSVSTGSLQVNGGLGVTGGIFSAGTINVNNNTQSTSSVTGAVIVNGGVGVNGNININGNLYLSGGLNFSNGQGGGGNTNIYSIDCCNNYSSNIYTLSAGNVVKFSNFSGMVIINNISTGGIQMFLCGGAGTYSLGGASVATGSFDGTSSSYFFTMVNNGQFTFFSIRTRNGP